MSTQGGSGQGGKKKGKKGSDGKPGDITVYLPTPAAHSSSLGGHPAARFRGSSDDVYLDPQGRLCKRPIGRSCVIAEACHVGASWTQMSGTHTRPDVSRTISAWAQSVTDDCGGLSEPENLGHYLPGYGGSGYGGSGYGGSGYGGSCSDPPYVPVRKSGWKWGMSQVDDDERSAN